MRLLSAGLITMYRVKFETDPAMGIRPGLRTALLAAASLTAVTVSVGHAAETARHQPAEIVMAADSVVSHEDPQSRASPARLFGWAAFAAGGAAVLARLLGRERIAEIGRTIAPAVRAAAAASAAAIQAVSRAVSAPIRFAAAFAALAAIGFAGLGLYDVEWAGGAIVGGGLVALAWAAAAGVRRFAAARANTRR